MRPATTLFLLTSADGKISTGPDSISDFDKDLPNICSTKKGLKQYYELEKKTAPWSFNTGNVLRKVGWNTITQLPKLKDVSFAILDNYHLDARGMENLSTALKEVVIITTNHSHPVFDQHAENVDVIVLDNISELPKAFDLLYSEYDCKELTIQSGSLTNNLLFNMDLVDYMSLVTAPICVGGKDTPSIRGGDVFDGSKLTELELMDVTRLKDNYVHLMYKVVRGVTNA